MNNLMDKIVSLAKRRGFIFAGSEIYGGLANSWDYGPLGVELKQNIKNFWWKKFVHGRDDVVGIDAALMMNPKVWEASGHLKEFVDPLMECKKCHNRFRADDVDPEHPCPNCAAKPSYTEAKPFNLMFKTFLGPIENEKSVVYLRPETAQAMFVNFKNILDTERKTVPFGIAQTGKAFRNEVTPGNFIFRTREFEMMEIEYFVREKEWHKWFEHWKDQMLDWVEELGIKKVHLAEVPEGERAHYSKRTIDFEYDFPFGRSELYGLAYRADFDLKRHMEASGADVRYTDPETGEKFIPHVIEPTWGVDRSVLAVLLEAYSEEKGPASAKASASTKVSADKSEGKRVVLKLPPKLAPYKAAVFPLLANKPALVKKAREIYSALAASGQSLGPIAFDDRGNIGKRYYAQDEIGTPSCVTVDFGTLGGGDDKKLKDTVTIRDRDTMRQERVALSQLEKVLAERLK